MNRVVLLLSLVGFLGIAPSLASADGMRISAEPKKTMVSRPEPKRFVIHNRRVANWKKGLQQVTPVPELDPNAAPIALALLLGSGALLAERRRKAATKG